MLDLILTQLQTIVNAMPSVDYFTLPDVYVYKVGEDNAADVHVFFPVGRDHADVIQTQLAANFNNFTLVGYSEDVAQYYPALSFDGIVFTFKTIDSAGGGGGAG
jgi:hypothetical protein